MILRQEQCSDEICPENKFGTQGLSQASEARRDCLWLPNGLIFIVYGEG